jgi:hypothetical protein
LLALARLKQARAVNLSSGDQPKFDVFDLGTDQSQIVCSLEWGASQVISSVLCTDTAQSRQLNQTR